MVNKRIDNLRSKMQERGIKAYYIPTSDFHESEYVGEHFKARAYISGFDGSAGFVVITQEEANLWTDGRYFLQAQTQLAGSYIHLMKQGEPGVPTLLEYLKNQLNKGDILGFDGRVVNTKTALSFKEELGVSLACEEDLVGLIWEDRPHLPKEKAWYLETKYTGRTIEDKLNFVKEHMNQRNADAFLISTLDDIAWLLNMRGSDIQSSPVALSYAIVRRDSVQLFIDSNKVQGELLEEFNKNHVVIQTYDKVYEYLKKLHNECILIDSEVNNYKLYSSINSDMRIIDEIRVTQLEKAIKNKVEIESSIDAHMKDGVAVTKFIFWVKEAVKKEQLTEYSIAEKLLEFRKEGKKFIEESFPTIAGYGANGAIVHYHALKETCAKLNAKGFLLVDSGGQYLDGTTDITRTIALGELSDEEKEHYTLVLKAHIALAKTQFKYGTRGSSLDSIARAPLWERGLNYNHGTGHGVGHVLNVHEGPNSIRYNAAAGKDVILEEGMIQSNEPGLYIEGSHGIRIENLIVVKKSLVNEYGVFMQFDQLTLVPYERDAILVSMLSEEEREWLNNYHVLVFSALKPYMNDCELIELKEATKLL